MLSQNPTPVQQRQQRHRRQQSTPNVFDPAKVQPLQRQSSHRRGISLDQRTRRQSTQQEYRVSNTNQGFQQQPQQHILRETQQQRLVRPGQQPQPYLTYDNDENFLISPLVTPQRSEFDAGCYDVYNGQRQVPQYSGPIETTTKVDPNAYSSFGTNDQQLCLEGSVTPSAYLDFQAGFEDSSGQQDWGATIKPNKRTGLQSRRVSGGIAGRVAQFEGMGGQHPASRPITPPSQNGNEYFPPTPASTPYHRHPQSQQAPQRFQEGYDTSMEQTIKPRGRSNQRAKNVFQEMREQAESGSRPLSPPGTAPMPSRAEFDVVKMPSSSSSMSYLKTDNGTQAAFYPHNSANFSPELSQYSSPEMSNSELYSSSTHDRANFGATHYHGHSSRSSVDSSQQYPPLKIEIEQSRRSESVDSLDPSETITDTGISIDEIAAYISGPDDAQKWLCLFPSCGKKFGRKENIKSHVQTHLGDRQYQCPHCKKCFVRQHDLKRHAKIHSGVKPYPCACGNSFARHDALTRHRQRGMCIGAFEGVVKKIVKRGRPRKNRPDDETRVDKASRTRNKNKTTGGSQSSASEYSESSYGPSPPADFDILDERPFDDFVMGTAQDFSQGGVMMSLDPSSSASFDNYSESSPMSMSASYVSPSAIHAHGSQVISAASPSAYSVHSVHSQHSQMSHHSQAEYRNGSIISLPDLDHSNTAAMLASHSGLPHLQPSSPPKSSANSAYSPAPALSLSSSSPSAPRYYDADIQGEELDLAKLAGLQMASESENVAVGDDTDLFLQQFGSEMMIDSGLDGGKFEDFVDPSQFSLSVGSMGAMGAGSFAEDVFFGSP